MLVTRKINIFSTLFGKPAAASNVNAWSAIKAHSHNGTNYQEIDPRLNIIKSENFYKAQAFNTINPLTRLNR